MGPIRIKHPRPKGCGGPEATVGYLVFHAEAQRTVICHRLDVRVYEHSPDEIAVEVGLKHGWAKAEEVFKFPRSSTCKITFTDTDMAKKALLEGLNLFQIHIPGHQMRQEMFIPLLTCNRYNLVEDHLINSWPRPAGYMQCSECRSVEHTYRNCSASTEKCLNSGGEHSARAMRCPIRKEALKKKDDIWKANVQLGISYAQTAQQAPLATGPAPTDPTKTLSKGLADNGLLYIKLPSPLLLRPNDAVVRALTEGAAQVIATEGPSTAIASSATSNDDSPRTPTPVPSPSEEDAEDGEDEAAQGPLKQEVRFAFLGRSSKKKRTPSSYNDLAQHYDPDIILINSHGLSDETRTLTTSDHVPIILNISTSPILIPIPPTYKYHTTDWDAFKEHAALRMTGLSDITYVSLEEIDDALETWMTTVRTTAERVVLR
ncbi:hypothetical protein E2C01_039560 [Portunus trituberculatus]|uniref:Uncharacterized protein n=1 Tax=Portunus trituberculatus TaxID=210409 RepID=A0A5B7FNC9_PORTR|nr:hypothetical protein [Portunus trituberculatus]